MMIQWHRQNGDDNESLKRDTERGRHDASKFHPLGSRTYRAISIEIAFARVGQALLMARKPLGRAAATAGSAPAELPSLQHERSA